MTHKEKIRKRMVELAALAMFALLLIFADLVTS